MKTERQLVRELDTELLTRIKKQVKHQLYKLKETREDAKFIEKRIKKLKQLEEINKNRVAEYKFEMKVPINPKEFGKKTSTASGKKKKR